jgi:hypothetical protein
MRSLFQVTTPATDISFMTMEDIRRAVRMTGDRSRDDDLKALKRRVEARIYRACRLRGDGVNPITLRQETVTETFRLTDVDFLQQEMQLARRPIVSVTSVTEETSLLDPTEYEIMADVGRLRRLSPNSGDNDPPLPWYWGAFGILQVVVVYQCGFAKPPDDLIYAGELLARTYWTRDEREPGLKQINIPGVIERQYWVDGATDDVSTEILDVLIPFTEPGGS